jgi:hypothetical protein
MWRGIFHNGGGLTINGNSTVQEALYGIAFRTSNIGLTIQNAVFRNNYIGILGNSTLANFSMVLSQSEFTTNASLKNWCGPGNGGIYGNPFSPSSGQFFTDRGWAGIYLNGMLTQTIGNGPGYNIFSELANGIVMQNSSAGTMAVLGGPITNGIQRCRFLHMHRGSYPVNIGGHGILFNSTVAGRFMRQVGSGPGSILSPTFNDCEIGVFARLPDYGKYSAIIVKDNRMTQMESGVWVLSSSGPVRAEVTNNDITSDTYFGHDIFGTIGIVGVYASFGTQNAATKVLIEGNTISTDYDFESGVIHCIRADKNYLDLNTAGEVEILNNQLTMNSKGSAIWLGSIRKGVVGDNEVNIVVEELIGTGISSFGGAENTISCNDVTGPPGGLDEGMAIQDGIYIYGVPQAQVVDNHITHFDRGMTFGFSNGASNIACNEFLGTNEQGLLVNADIGNQPDKGNYWYCTSLGPFNWEALNNAGLGDHFTAQLGTDFFPDFWSPNDFYINSNNPTPSCPSNPNCDLLIAESQLTNADLLVANGQSLGGYGGWTNSAKQTLYRKLKDDPGLLTGNLLMQNFLSAQANTTVGLFYELREDIFDLPNAAATEQAALDANLSEELDIVADMRDITDLLANNPPEPLYSQLVAQYNALAEDLEELNEADSLLLLAVEVAQVDAADDLLAFLDGITATQPWEVNEKQVFEIFLSTIAQGIGEGTNAQLEALEDIAAECPNEGGRAVLDAIQLYSALTGEQLEIVDCGTQEREGNARNTAASNAALTLVPNPSLGPVTVQYRLPNDEAGQVIVTDLHGRLVVYLPIESGTGATMLPVFNRGVYFVRMMSKGTVLEQSKLVQF